MEVLGSLTSETARAILEVLADVPATTTDIANRVDTSRQNVHYHLRNLCDAGVVTAAGTWYSAKGQEMTVYALTSERIEIRIGKQKPANPRRDAPTL